MNFAADQAILHQDRSGARILCLCGRLRSVRSFSVPYVLRVAYAP